jgi:predicted SAM-dependent methyltransferase
MKIKFLLKIKYFLSPFYHKLKREPYYSLYKLNQFLVNILYGGIDDIKISKIQKSLNDFVIENYDKFPTNYKDSTKKIIKNLLVSKLTDEQFDGMDKITKLYETTYDFCRILHDSLASEIRKYSKSPYCIVNTRVWITRPGSEPFGPNTMHTDGFYPGHFKIMIYPHGLSVDNGYLIVDKNILNDQPPGTTIFFKNSDINHAGVSGIINERLAVEITILRSLFHLPQNHSGHPNGRHYKNFAILVREYFRTISLTYIFNRMMGDNITKKILELKISVVKKINTQFSCKKINLGSGKKSWILWRCFDELKYPTIETLKFNAATTLPEDVDSINLFYSSHNLEHLDDDTVDNIFNQVFKKLNHGGTFVIKMPDFEYLIHAYRNGELSEINDSGVLDTMYTWPMKKVLPTIENKISMVFCGYMSKDYGNHFESDRSISKNSYHGPCVISQEKLKKILLNESVRNISKILKEHALLDENFGQFNHQNSWSRDDLKLLIEKRGLKLISTDTKKIVKKYKYLIPDIKTSMNSSMYLEFIKP